MMPLPLYSMTDPGFEFHHGITFEANLGAFGAHVGGDQFGGSSANYAGLGGLDVGLGGWLTRRLALTLRIAGGEFKNNGTAMIDAFVGPSAQVWIDPHVWIGGRVGVALVGQASCNDATMACSTGAASASTSAARYSFWRQRAHDQHLDRGDAGVLQRAHRLHAGADEHRRLRPAVRLPVPVDPGSVASRLASRDSISQFITGGDPRTFRLASLARVLR